MKKTRVIWLYGLACLAGAILLLLMAGQTTYADTPQQATPTPLPTLELDYTPASDGPLTEPGHYSGVMTVEEMERRYTLHIPTGYDPATPAPLVISFHGYTSSPENHAAYTGLVQKAEATGYLLLMPQGQGDPPAWFTHDEAERFWLDDVLFTRTLLEHLETRLAIDPQRIYATGMSNGGGMAGRIGCDMADVIAAIAPVSANHFFADRCTPVRPVPVMSFHGLEDTITPYEGQSTLLANIPEWSRNWAERNSCNPEPESSEREVQTRIPMIMRTDHWTGCQDGADVWLHTYTEMGHAYPASNAPDMMWDFFAAHPMPQEYINNPPTELIIIPADEEGATRQLPPGDYVAQMIVDGRQRPYYLHIPPDYTGQEAVPLIISFHDFGANPVQNAGLTGLSQVADEQNFIVVYPGGSGDPLTWYPLAAESDEFPDDVEVVRVLLAHLQSSLNIDEERVYAVGYSIGGSMAHRVACDLSDRFTAFAVVNAAYFIDDSCEAANPVSVLAIHGTGDTVLPYDGGPRTLSAPDWSAGWAERNGCGDPFEDGDLMVWSDCEGGSRVTLRTLPDAGHAWPEDATPTILNFFGLQE